MEALFEKDDLAAEFDIFAGLSDQEWRVERRYRRRKDGTLVMYWNYRRRKVSRNNHGGRRIEYRRGGSRPV